MRIMNYGPCPYCPDGIITDGDVGMCDRCDSAEKFDADDVEAEVERWRYEHEFAAGIWPEPDPDEIPF